MKRASTAVTIVCLFIGAVALAQAPAPAKPFANPTTFNVKSEASADGKTYVLALEGKWTKTK